MKTKYKLSLAISFCFLTIFGFGPINVLAAPVLHEAYELYSYYYDPYGMHCYARYDLQGDVVYEDESGYTDYAIWLTGTNDYIYDVMSTRIITYIYISAYYVRDRDIFPLQTTYYWAPIPSGLITWTGDWELHTDYYRWDWTVSGQERYSTIYASLFKYGSGSYSSKNSISGDYRYLGYAVVTRSGGWTYYDALMELHVDNALAEDHDGGIYTPSGEGWFWITRLLNFRIKIVTKFQYEWFGWRTAFTTQTFILGDGSPSSDLSSIPLVLGTVEGASHY